MSTWELAHRPVSVNNKHCKMILQSISSASPLSVYHLSRYVPGSGYAVYSFVTVASLPVHGLTGAWRHLTHSCLIGINGFMQRSPFSTAGWTHLVRWAGLGQTAEGSSLLGHKSFCMHASVSITCQLRCRCVNGVQSVLRSMMLFAFYLCSKHFYIHRKVQLRKQG